MCGIVGIWGAGFSGNLSETLTRMLGEIAHRGPDGDGIWIDPQNRGGIGHKRLAIIDPAGGQQPMSNEDDTVRITFNGCIYNYQDISRNLRQKGHIFKTYCDTEVIIHAYEEWGPECVNRFNGMWAFAIWDERKKILFCSRDRLGIKPFYYSWNGRRFVFGSEIKALLAGGEVAAEPDPDGLRQYLTFQFCLNETTLFKGVKRLDPGHNLILKPGAAPRISTYWDIKFEIDEKHDEDYFADKLTMLLEDAVRLRLRADVPLGAHLSGGLDSSSIVGLTSMLLGDIPIKTFTGAFGEGKAYDETEYAKLVAKQAGAHYLQIDLTARSFVQSMEKIIWHMDEPAAGPGVFPQFWVSKLAGEQVKVLLGGQGGDELFVGYARYLIAYLEECLKGAIQNTAHQAEYVVTLENIVPSLPSLDNYIPMLKTFWSNGLFEEPARRYFKLMDRFSGSRKFLHPDFKVDDDKTLEEFSLIFDRQDASAMINRILYFDIKTHLQALLHVEDRVSMAWGLESRVPLLDHRLVELMAAIPPVIKFKKGSLKYLFRKSVKNFVPPKILDRKDKMGFPVPLSVWFKGELRDFLGDLLLSKRARERNIFDSRMLEKTFDSKQPFDRSVWGMLCLELWYRQFMD